MQPAELAEALRLHARWLAGDPTGSQADLRGADLTGADLTGAALRAADLSGARLRRARLENADLAGACLARADLRGADLRGAVLAGADLRDADLWLAVFHGHGAAVEGLCTVLAGHGDGFTYHARQDKVWCRAYAGPTDGLAEWTAKAFPTPGQPGRAAHDAALATCRALRRLWLAGNPEY